MVWIHRSECSHKNKGCWNTQLPLSILRGKFITLPSNTVFWNFPLNSFPLKFLQLLLAVVNISKQMPCFYFNYFFFPPSLLFFRECHFSAQNSILHIFRSAFKEIPQGSQSVSACRAPPSAWCCPALQDHCADCSKQAHTKLCPVTPGGLLVKPMVGQHQTTQSEHYPHQLGLSHRLLSHPSSHWSDKWWTDRFTNN